MKGEVAGRRMDSAASVELEAFALGWFRGSCSASHGELSIWTSSFWANGPVIGSDGIIAAI